MLNIQYQNFELESNQCHVGKILDTYSVLFPSWLRTLTVSIYDTYSKQPDGMVAWSKARPEYGSAEINVLSTWLDRPGHQQHSFILHEILHIAQRREYNFIWDRLLNPVEKRNKELHGYLIEDYRQRNEEFIEGLTHAILEGGSLKGIARDA